MNNNIDDLLKSIRKKNHKIYNYKKSLKELNRAHELQLYINANQRQPIEFYRLLYFEYRDKFLELTK